MTSNCKYKAKGGKQGSDMHPSPSPSGCPHVPVHPGFLPVTPPERGTPGHCFAVYITFFFSGMAATLFRPENGMEGDTSTSISHHTVLGFQESWRGNFCCSFSMTVLANRTPFDLTHTTVSLRRFSFTCV